MELSKSKPHKQTKDDVEEQDEVVEEKKTTNVRPTKTSAEYWKQMQGKWSADSVRIMNELSRQNALLESLLQSVKRGQEEQQKMQKELVKMIRQLYYDPRRDRW